MSSRDAQRLAQPGHVRRSRLLEHVVAGVAVLERGVAAGEDALPDEGGVAVGRQDVVPCVDAVEEPVEVHGPVLRPGVPGGRGPCVFSGVPCWVWIRTWPRRLTSPRLEVDVVHEVLGAGQGRPVGGRAGRSLRVAAGTCGGARGGDPRRADVRREGAERRLQGARVAAVAAAAVRGEDGAVGAQREPELDAVVQLQGRRPGAAQRVRRRACPPGGAEPQRRLQGAVRAVQRRSGPARAAAGRGGGSGAPGTR